MSPVASMTLAMLSRWRMVMKSSRPYALRNGIAIVKTQVGDRYVIEGIDKVEPNAKVCTEVNAEKFLQMFVSRIQGK